MFRSYPLPSYLKVIASPEQASERRDALFIKASRSHGHPSAQMIRSVRLAPSGQPI